MPFKSKAQARYMFAKHPKIAEEFASKTNMKTLPEKMHKSKVRKAAHKLMGGRY